MILLALTHFSAPTFVKVQKDHYRYNPLPIKEELSEIKFLDLEKH
jgi:hypothetical protein